MTKNKLWVRVEPDTSIGANSIKETYEGPGSFMNAHGIPDVSGDTLVRRWGDSSMRKGFLTCFALLWNTFISFFIADMVSGEMIPFKIAVNGTRYANFEEVSAQDPIVFVIFLFPLFGLFVGYLVLCLWVNKTSFRLERSTLSVSHGPLPWFRKNLNLNVTKIRQAYVQQYTSHEENKRPVTSFRVVLQLVDGSEKVLDQGLRNYSDARILEQWVEKKLRLEDRPVIGEVA